MNWRSYEYENQYCKILNKDKKLGHTKSTLHTESTGDTIKLKLTELSHCSYIIQLAKWFFLKKAKIIRLNQNEEKRSDPKVQYCHEKMTYILVHNYDKI